MSPMHGKEEKNLILSGKGGGSLAIELVMRQVSRVDGVRVSREKRSGGPAVTRKKGEL